MIFWSDQLYYLGKKMIKTQTYYVTKRFKYLVFHLFPLSKSEYRHIEKEKNELGSIFFTNDSSKIVISRHITHMNCFLGFHYFFCQTFNYNQPTNLTPSHPPRWVPSLKEWQRRLGDKKSKQMGLHPKLHCNFFVKEGGIGLRDHSWCLKLAFVRLTLWCEFYYSP